MRSGRHSAGDRGHQQVLVGEPTWVQLGDDDFEAAYPLSARPRAISLHRILVRSLLPVVREMPDDEELKGKPLELELDLPLPPRLRFYMFLATQHESERQPDTYRIQLTTGEEVSGGRRRFSRTDGIRPVLIGFDPRLDVFIIWDADVNDAGGGFKYSQGVQAPPEVVYGALADGMSQGSRNVQRAKRSEMIVAVRRERLIEGLLRRIELSNNAITEPPQC